MRGHNNSARILLQAKTNCKDRMQILEVQGLSLPDGVTPMNFVEGIAKGLESRVQADGKLPVKDSEWGFSLRSMARSMKANLIERLSK